MKNKNEKVLLKLSKPALLKMLYDSYEETQKKIDENLQLQGRLHRLTEQLNRATRYIKQGKGMINSIMNRW